MINLSRLSMNTVKDLTLKEGELILKEKNLLPSEIKSLQECGFKVSHQYCSDLGEYGYKVYMI